MQKRGEFSVEGQKVVGDLHLPEGSEEPFPGIITSHGYKSHRQSEKYFQIGHRFPLEGIAVLRFDHRGALGGESDGGFEDTTLTKRVEDLKAAIDFLAKIKEVDSNRLGLLGSSLGGMDVLIIKDQKVKAKVVMATPFSFPMPSEEMLKSFAEKGDYQYPDGNKITKDFYEDFKKYDLREEVKETKCPLLIIHGDLDEQVPRHHAKVLYETAGSEIKELKMIEGGDHAFTDLDKLNEVLAYALNWFKKYLLGQEGK